MSDSSRVTFRRLKEVSFGVTPASAMTNTRFTGESLGFNIETEVSNEIRGDRQIPDLIRVGAEAAGDMEFELSGDTYDDFFESVLYSAAFPAVDTITAMTISAATADDSFNDSGSGFPTFAVGEWIRVKGFVDPANNGFFKVLTPVTTAKLLVDANLVVEAVGPSITIDESTIRNGVVRSSYSLEKEFVDITQFLSYTGMIPGTMDLEVAAGAILTGSFGFLGLASARGVATIGTGAPVVATATDVMNAVDNISLIREFAFASDLTVDVQSVSLSVDNNLRPIDAIGTLGHVDVGAGRSTITGNINIYFSDGTMYDEYLNDVPSKLAFAAEKGTEAYLFELPRIEFTSSEVVAGSIDEDVMVNADFQAVREPTDDYTIQISKYT